MPVCSAFQPVALEKLRQLRAWIDEHPDNLEISLLVDGGVNAKTAASIREAGADILVAGTFLFRNEASMQAGAAQLMS